ncbi:DUF3726 domain-containing protein [Maritimibacter sp. 55A14]|uniref:DUF3726 domain-containing protein n=1 Tax=Maritimibacter sp. 55A14 TaxID=2174844 RepID=UPI000D618577|nr:DUF3726 domain-containing protein [Maritimibacter sp. 55A14]PWE33864.1 DUF3726 domain-containing protein [Maritimibacter sp. 55A14]
MTPSLSEIETLGKRAARGAGLSWGLAEEAGRAARWLSAHGLPGVESLAALLERNDGVSYGALAPVCLETGWRPAGAVICPLVAGAALADRAAAVAGGAVAGIGPVACPVLLAPAAAGVAAATGATLDLAWDNLRLTVGPDAVWLEAGKAARLARPEAAEVRIRIVAEGHGTPCPAGQRPEVTGAEWARLARLAHRTYAPATDASRLAGAGAGLSDND